MSNEQDNKPEETAMQEMINYVETQQEKHSGHGANDTWRQLQRIIDKAIEIRDTVEKDRHKETWIEGFLYGVKGANGHIDGHPIRDGIQADMIGKKEYNYKYATDGK